MSGGVVWILGAGFSQPLGAPLLFDLLGEGSANRLLAAFPNSKLLHQTRAMSIVRALYAYGTAWRNTRPPAEALLPGEQIWTDAEQFLEMLDAAEPNTPQARRLNPLLTKLATHVPFPAGNSGDAISLELIRDDARAHVAAECAAFLEGADPTVEQWSPFRKWRAELDRWDCVVSFNYDRICEVLPSQGNKCSLRTILPADLAADAPRPADVVPLLKLHGSVDWEFTDDRTSVRRAAAKIQDQAGTDRVGIATPGKTKQSAASKAFKPLWDEATVRIATAQAIVFVGYRFPPSDAFAREQLLGAIRQNNVKNLQITTVLGKHGADSERLGELLRFALRKRGRADGKLYEPPLYSQDLFSIWDRSSALNPYRD